MNIKIFIAKITLFLLLSLAALWSQAFALEQKTFTVVLDWFINPNHAPLMVAEQEGFFARQGIKVKFITPSDASSGEKMVAADQADIAITYQPALLLHVVQGLPLARFATLINTPLSCVVALKDSGIRTIKDFQGKFIGYSATGIDGIIFSAMLQAAHLNIDDVKLVNVKFNLVQALLTNKIAGFIGGMRNFEPLAVEFAGKKVVVFYPEEHGLPHYDELILVVNKNKIHDPYLIKFAVALKEGVAYLKKNPDKSWQKFIAKHPEINDELNKKAWFVTLPYFADNPLQLDRSRYQNFAKFMWKRKLIKYLPPLTDYTF